jgi:hypothetical protein
MRYECICADCGCDTEEIGEYNYLLLDDVWEQIWPGTTFKDFREMEGKYILCIGCAEKRLGRELKPEDFNPDYAPILSAGEHVQRKAGVTEEEKQLWKLYQE